MSLVKEANTQEHVVSQITPCFDLLSLMNAMVSFMMTPCDANGGAKCLVTPELAPMVLCDQKCHVNLF